METGAPSVKSYGQQVWVTNRSSDESTWKTWESMQILLVWNRNVFNWSYVALLYHNDILSVKFKKLQF